MLDHFLILSQKMTSVHLVILFYQTTGGLSNVQKIISVIVPESLRALL